MPDFPNDLIPADKTAKDLHVEPQTLSVWRSTGRGPDYYKIGRNIFYSEAGNRAWIELQRRSPRRASSE
jgi:hypothetical protein